MKKDFSIRELNTFGFDVKTMYFQEINSIEDISFLFDNQCFIEHRNRNRILILSGGSNILFKNEVFDGFIVHPNIKGIETICEDGSSVIVRCFCGEIWKDFVEYTVNRNLHGIENLADIPGLVGAAPVQNIGAYGVEVKDVIQQVHTIDLMNGKMKSYSNEECHFAYRNSVFKERSAENSELTFIYAIDFVLNKNRNLILDYGNIRNHLANNNITDPTIKDVFSAVKKIRGDKLPELGVVGSAGSFFQNAIVSVSKFEELKLQYPDIPSYPMSDAFVKIPTGWLIEKAGWKGYRENHVGVWDKQALVLVHYGGGKPCEIFALMDKIQHSVFKMFGIDIKPEVNIVGR